MARIFFRRSGSVFEVDLECDQDGVYVTDVSERAFCANVRMLLLCFCLAPRIGHLGSITGTKRMVCKPLWRMVRKFFFIIPRKLWGNHKQCLGNVEILNFGSLSCHWVPISCDKLRSFLTPISVSLNNSMIFRTDYMRKVIGVAGGSIFNGPGSSGGKCPSNIGHCSTY